MQLNIRIINLNFIKQITVLKWTLNFNLDRQLENRARFRPPSKSIEWR